MPPFHIHMCADVRGEKRNIEVVFEKKPASVGEIADEGEVIFRNECILQGVDPRTFSVDFIVFYEDDTRRWKPLENPNQVVDYMQLYLFQSGGSQETIREIPPPSSATSALSQQQRVIHKPGSGSTVDMDKVQYVFNEMDINETRTVELNELVHGFSVTGIDFNEETISRLFLKSDSNNDGNITFDEFVVFAELFPNCVETLFWRFRTLEMDPNNRQAAVQLKKQRQKEHQIRRQLAEAENERKALQGRMRQEQVIARELDPRRRFLEDEEQDLINKEFALQFHRDMVVQAETHFSETAVRFNRAAEKQGSPRRARYV